MRSLLSALFLLFSSAVFCQPVNLKAADKFVETVDQHLANGSLKQKHPAMNSRLGGTFDAYYLNKKLVLITSHHGGPFGFIDHSYYIERDSVVFATVRKVVLKEPENEKEYTAYEKYLIFHTDKNGKTDLTKWPLTVDINNLYYFSHNQIVKYSMKNLGKTIRPVEKEIEEATGDLLFRFQTHIKEMSVSDE